MEDGLHLHVEHALLLSWCRHSLGAKWSKASWADEVSRHFIGTHLATTATTLQHIRRVAWLANSNRDALPLDRMLNSKANKGVWNTQLIEAVRETASTLNCGNARGTPAPTSLKSIVACIREFQQSLSCILTDEYAKLPPHQEHSIHLLRLTGEMVQEDAFWRQISTQFKSQSKYRRIIHRPAIPEDIMGWSPLDTAMDQAHNAMGAPSQTASIATQSVFSIGAPSVASAAPSMVSATLSETTHGPAFAPQPPASVAPTTLTRVEEDDESSDDDDDGRTTLSLDDLGTLGVVM